MAAQDLTTIDNAKAWLPISATNTADDAVIGRLITAVSMDFMRATARPELLLADYVEVRQGDGSARLVAYHWPIVAVASLTIGGAAVAASPDKIAAGYYFDQDIDPERIWQLYLQGYRFADGAAVQLEYSAGYAPPGTALEAGQIALPADIEQAVLDWLGYRYKGRPNVGVTMRRSTEGEQSWPEHLDAPPNVLEVIARYKRAVPCVDRRGEEREERVARPAPRSGRPDIRVRGK